MRHLPTILLVCAAAIIPAAETTDPGLAILERIVLSPDRRAAWEAVGTLPGGSRDRLWHEAILLQHDGRLTEAETRITELAATDPTAATQLRWRQALLLWGTDRAAATARLRDLRGAPETGNITFTKGGLASTLDPLLIDGRRLLDTTLAESGPGGLSIAGLEQLDPARLDGPAARHALEQLGQNWHPRLEDLLAVACADADAPSFATIAPIALLGRPLLESLAARVPRLRTDRDLTACWMAARLAEDGAEADQAGRRLARAADLARFAAELPAGAAHLRRAAAWWRLRLDDEAGRDTAEALRAWLSCERDAAESTAWPDGDAIGLPSPDPAVANRVADRCLLDQLAGNADAAAWAGLVESATLSSMHLRARLGAGVAATGGDALQIDSWRHQTAIEVIGGDIRRRPGEAVSLNVAVSGAREMLVRIHPLEPLQVARNPALVHPYMDRGGCIPAHERTWELNPDPLRRHRLHLALPEITGAGTWLVELIAGDRRIETVVRCGWLDALPVAGGLLILDEAGRPCAGAQARFRTLNLMADATGRLRLPRLPWDAAESGEVDDLAITHQGRSLQVRHRAEPHSARLDARLTLDAEQLAAGGTATALLAWRLDIDAVRADASLRGGRLTIITTTTDGATRTTILPVANDPRQADLAAPFPVPLGLAAIDWKIEGWIDTPAGRREITDGGQIQTGQIRTTRDLDDLRLLGDADGYRLLALGRGGQPRPERVVDLRLGHRWLQHRIHIRLITDQDGVIRLGRLPLIDDVYFDDRPDGFFLIPASSGAASRIPRTCALPAGASLRLPLPADTAAELWQLAGRRMQARLATGLRREGASVIVGPLTPGSYRLVHERRDCDITVAATAIGPDPDGAGSILVADDRQAIRATPATPLAVRLDRDGGNLRIAVDGGDARTRVHVFARRSLDCAPPMRDVHADSTSWARHPLLGETGEAVQLGAEDRYRLARQKQPAMPGMLLERPGLTLRPWHDPDLDPDFGQPHSGAYGCRSGGGKRRAIGAGGGSKGSDQSWPGSWADPDLMPAPSVLLANLRTDADGRLVIPIDRLGAAGLVWVMARNDGSTATALLPLPAQPVLWRDRRHLQALPTDQPHILIREARVLPPGADPAPPDGTLRQRIFAGADQVFAWYQARGDLDVGPLHALTGWDGLPPEQQRRTYGELASHEADLWLARHDPAFFATVVRPLLGGLVQPGAVDAILAGSDPTPWLEPHRLAAMNAAELALLARAAPATAPRLRAMLADRTIDDDEPRREAAALRRAAVACDTADATTGSTTPVTEAIVRETLPVGREDVALELPDSTADLRPEAIRPTTYVDRGWFRISHGAVRPGLIPACRFWRELAAAPPGTGVLTPALLAVEGGRSAVTAAIACSDLPLHAPPPDAHGRHPQATLLVRERVQPVTPAPADGLVIDGAIFQPGSPEPAGRQLLAWQAYDLRWRIVEMSGKRRTIDLLAEVPVGAIALAGEARFTRTIVLEPFDSQTVELPFFLVDPGAHACFALHAAVDGRLVAAGSPPVLAVAPPGVDDGRWWTGTPDAIATRLRSQRSRLLDTDLLWVGHRLADPAVWQAVVETLEARGAFRPAVWAWAAEHGDEARLRQWLRLDESVAKLLGGAVRSPLLTLLPLPDRTLIHLDIAEVVNPRWWHEAGRPPQEPLVATRWREVLTQAALLPAADDALALEISYLLMLQDRHAESTAWLKRIAPTAPWRMQMAYLDAWLALARGDATAAARAAQPLLAAELVPPWSGRRDALAEHLVALEAIAPRPVSAGDRQLDQALARAAVAPALSTRLSGRTIEIRAQGFASGELRFYSFDPEANFLANPFAAWGTQIPLVAPTRSMPFTPAPGFGDLAIAIPDELYHKTLLIVAVGGGLEEKEFYSGAAVQLRVAPADGVLTVTGGNGKPVAAAYVRVHGDAGFIRDGRTDLLGRFDLHAIPESPKRLAVFVDAGDLGATSEVVNTR